MDVKTVKDLGEIADLCRKKGIESIKIGADSVEFKLAEAPPKRPYNKKSDQKSEDPIESGDITPEDILYWSSQGIPAGNS